VVADVCDKGLGAALFMTLFRSLLRAASNMGFYARVGSGNADSAATRLKDAISLTNNYIAENHGGTGMFATVFFGILDVRTGRLAYINCGHLSPLIINDVGIKQTLDLTGPALGAVLDAKHGVMDVELEHGDMLFAYTDGVTDTENPAGEVFSRAKLIPLLTQEQSLSTLLEQILERVESHAEGAKQFDDITMLALRRV
jgi:sigma-B regulation protein RsbU (phosphoserine phosphatase)